MAVDLEKSEIQSGIGIKHVMNFVKQSWKKIIIFAGFSFAITVFLIVLGYIVLPRETSYTSSVRIQLPKQKHTIVYPNGKAFSATDIISTAVLRRVYDNRKIEKKSEKKAEFSSYSAFSKVTTIISGRLNSRKGNALLPMPRLTTIWVRSWANTPASYLGKSP